MSWYTAAASLASGVLSALAGKYGVDKEVQEQRELQDRAYEMDIAKWNMMKDYERPQAQMERFKEAGLNPDLIYGQQSSAPAMPESSVPNAPNIAAAYNSAAGNINESMLIASQIQKNEADADQANANAYKDRKSVDMLFPAMMEQYYSQAGLNKQKVAESQENVKLIQQNVNTSIALAGLYRSSAALNDVNKEILDVKKKYADQYYDQSVKALIAKTNLDEQNKNYLFELTDRLKRTHDLYISLLTANRNLANAQTGLANSQTRLNDSQTDLNKQRKEWYEKPIEYPEYDKDGKPTGKTITTTYGELMIQMEAKQYELLNMQLRTLPMQVMFRSLGQIADVKSAIHDVGVEKSDIKYQGSTSGAFDESNHTSPGQRAAAMAAAQSYEQFLVSYEQMLVDYMKQFQ